MVQSGRTQVFPLDPPPEFMDMLPDTASRGLLSQGRKVSLVQRTEEFLEAFVDVPSFRPDRRCRFFSVSYLVSLFTSSTEGFSPHSSLRDFRLFFLASGPLALASFLFSFSSRFPLDRLTFLLPFPPGLTFKFFRLRDPLFYVALRPRPRPQIGPDLVFRYLVPRWDCTLALSVGVSSELSWSLTPFHPPRLRAGFPLSRPFFSKIDPFPLRLRLYGHLQKPPPEAASALARRLLSVYTGTVHFSAQFFSFLIVFGFLCLLTLPFSFSDYGLSFRNFFS